MEYELHNNIIGVKMPALDNCTIAYKKMTLLLGKAC